MPRIKADCFLLPEIYAFMAEVSTFCGMSESEMAVLNETLQAQQQLLRKLYAELDQEREASATAASEALSMILRLQGEKAAVKMEASQYKRLAEEKICHAEESLEIFEDLIYQKEMEIASLEFQVQAYKCKLLSLGCSDMVASENRFPENLLLQGSDFCKGETCVVGGGNVGNVRRHGSLPPIPLKDSHHKKSAAEREKSPPVVLDLVPKKVDKKLDKEISVESLDLEKKSGHSLGGSFSSYWQQIKALDEQVKEIAHCNNSARDKSTSLNSGSRSCSSPSLSSSHDLTGLDLMTLLDEVKSSDNPCQSDPIGTSCSSTIQDIFEVPKHKENHNIQTKGPSKITEDKLGSLDLVSKKTGKVCHMDETDNVKKILHESNLYEPRDEISLECNTALVHPTTGVAETQAKFQQLCQRVDRLEGERSGTSQEITYPGEEERKLLREIHEQLNTIRAEISSLKEKETLVPDDEPVHCLNQVCLSCLFNSISLHLFSFYILLSPFL